MAKILIVDDEEADRLFERSVLEDAGHSLYFASDGEAALRVYRDHAVEVVITDLHMPRVDGLRLIQGLRELNPDAGIIAVSGVAANQLGTAGELGAARTLFKPVDPRELVAAVADVLARQGGEDPVEGHDL